jgi:hypothetical protein
MESTHTTTESNSRRDLFKREAEFWIPRLGVMVEESKFFELIEDYLGSWCDNFDIVIEETEDSNMRPVEGACWIHYGIRDYIGRFVCGEKVYKFLIVADIITIERSHSKNDLVVIDRLLDFGLFEWKKDA